MRLWSAARFAGLLMFIATVVSAAAPQWIDSDIDLGIQNEGIEWSVILTDYVRKDANDTVTFTATGLPAWMKFDAANNKLYGKPGHSDAGNYSGIKLTVTSPQGSASATAHGTVKGTVHPPTWVSDDPITLTADATEDYDFTYDLNQYVLNPEGAPLQFSIASPLAPAWLRVGQASGLLYGMPAKDDVGPVTVAVQILSTIENVPYQDVVTFKFQVKHRNHNPSWVSKTIQLPDAHTKQNYSQSLRNSVSDSDNDPLIFTISGPSWLKIDPTTGALSGNPTNADVTAPGSASVWTVTAKDPGNLSDSTQLTIRVLKSKEPPNWTANPIVLKDAPEDAFFSTDLSAYAKDPDGEQLTFTMLNGPRWLSLSPRGILKGIPRTADVGPVSVTVRAEDNVTGSAITTVTFLVTPVNHAPFWVFSPIVISAIEDRPVNANISGYAADSDKADAGSLVFSVISGPTPAWAQLNDKGVFTGTPGAQSTGEQKYKVRVADTAGAFADVDVIFNVQHVNHAPKWTTTGITLSPNAKEGTEYRASLAQYATDPDIQDQGKLSFEKAGPLPGWLTLASDGTLSGIPQRADVGTTTFQVRVMDPSSEQSVGSFTVTVDLTKRAPRWRQNPVLLSKAFEGLNFQFNLGTDYVAAESNTTLTYSLINGPRWMAVSANGVISGVPSHNDVGKFTAKIRVADGELFADANATGEVVQRFQGPVISPNLPSFVVKEGATLTVKLNDPQYVTNPDGGELTFGPPVLADWITLGADGTLIAKPQKANVGDASFAFVVSSPHGSTNGTLKLRVLGNGTGQPPVWSVPQLTLTIPVAKQYQGSVATLATDPGNKKLTFSKVDGKTWLTVAGDGTLTALPADNDVGTFNFTLSACNADNACASVPLVVTVTGAGSTPGEKTQVVKLGETVTGARAEHLWVVDSSLGSQTLGNQLKSSIGTYFQSVKTVSHASVFLASDPDEHDGNPIPDGNGNNLLLSSMADPAGNFVARMTAAFSPGASCSNCNNSPIWAMYRFYLKAPRINDIYRKGYLEAGEPMEVMIVSQQTDHYKSYAQDANATVYDFLQRFRTFHRNEKLPFRINVIAPPALSLSDKAGSPGDPNAYGILTKNTGGDYFEVKAGFDMNAALRAFATKVTYRANAYARKRVALEATPADPTAIKVSLGTKDLAGNTGAAGDLWRYDRDRNEVVMNWPAIDSSLVVPDTELTIKYRSN